MTYRIDGLAPHNFTRYWAMPDAELAEHGIRRLRADSGRGFPCRISLQDARAGESLLLLPFQHHDVPGPYRASGPIYVRQLAGAAASHVDEIPEAFLRRLISVRGYDAEGWMQEAEVVEGTELDASIRQMFGNAGIHYLHLHNARPGCFAARVDRY